MSNRRADLERLRDGLWDRFESAMGDSLSAAAGLSRQIREVTAELEGLADDEAEPRWKGRDADEVAERRNARAKRTQGKNTTTSARGKRAR